MKLHFNHRIKANPINGREINRNSNNYPCYHFFIYSRNKYLKYIV